MNKRFLKAALLMVLAMTVTLSGIRAQTQAEGAAKIFSLKEAIRYALKHNVNIKNARFDEYIAKYRAQEYVGVGLPQLKFGMQVTDMLQVPTQVIPASAFVPGAPEDATLAVQFGIQYNADASLSLSQLIFDGSFFVGVEAAKKLVEVTAIGTERSKIETAYQVATAYYTALMSEEKLKMLDINIDNLQELFSNTRALYESGFVEKIDVDRLSINLQNLETEKMKARRLVDLTHDLLKFQMGMPIEEDVILTDKVDEDLENLPEMLSFNKDESYHQDRIEYALMEGNLRLQELNLKRYKIGRLPSIVAFGSYGRQAPRQNFDYFRFDGRWYHYANIGVSVNFTIFDGFQNRARMAQTSFEIKKLENNRSMFEQSVVLEVRKAQADMLNAYNTLENYKKTLSLAQEVYDITKIKWEEGVGSNLEVLESETTLRTSQNNYLGALYEFTLAKIELEKAKGEILPPMVELQMEE